MKLSKQALTLLLCFFTCAVHCASRLLWSREPNPASSRQLRRHNNRRKSCSNWSPRSLVPGCLGSHRSWQPRPIQRRFVEADRWMQSHSGLKGEKLAQEVDKQSWDPSVKALAQFPSVLENMDKKPVLEFISGDAYANDPQGVTDAVQTMRQQARKAWQSEQQ